MPHHPITSITDLRDNVIEAMFNTDYKPEKDQIDYILEKTNEKPYNESYQAWRNTSITN